MKSKFIYSVIFTFALLTNLTVQANGFIPVFEDVPLMDGLTHVVSDDIVFGNEESSYREAHLLAEKTNNFPDVVNFYQKTLPQLGWRFQKKNQDIAVFHRENAILEIRKIDSKPLKISISLKNEN